MNWPGSTTPSNRRLRVGCKIRALYRKSPTHEPDWCEEPAECAVLALERVPFHALLPISFGSRTDPSPAVTVDGVQNEEENVEAREGCPHPPADERPAAGVEVSVKVDAVVKVAVVEPCQEDVQRNDEPESEALEA